MNTRILTATERKLIQAFLKTDGKKTMHMRVVATRARQFLPQIKSDLELLEKLVSTYDSMSRRVRVSIALW